MLAKSPVGSIPSLQAAQVIFSAPVSVGVASGVAFPDALSGGRIEARIGGPSC